MKGCDLCCSVEPFFLVLSFRGKKKKINLQSVNFPSWIFRRFSVAKKKNLFTGWTVQRLSLFKKDLPNDKKEDLVCAVSVFLSRCCKPWDQSFHSYRRLRRGRKKNAWKEEIFVDSTTLMTIQRQGASVKISAFFFFFIPLSLRMCILYSRNFRFKGVSCQRFLCSQHCPRHFSNSHIYNKDANLCDVSFLSSN